MARGYWRDVAGDLPVKEEAIALLVTLLAAQRAAVLEEVAAEFSKRRENCLRVMDGRKMFYHEALRWQFNADLLKQLVDWLRQQAQEPRP